MHHDSPMTSMRLPSLATRHGNGTGMYEKHGPPAGSTDAPTDDNGENRLVANARREFASAFGDLAKGKRNWQIVAFTLAAVVTVQAITTYRLASAAHAVPYLVQVDRLGNLAAAGKAEPLTDPNGRLVASQLADFIRAVRTVLPTAAMTAQADLLRRGYAFATPPAAGFLNSYFADPTHDPRLLGQRITRDVQLSSILRVPEPSQSKTGRGDRSQTWRVQWVETDRSLDIADSTVLATWEGYVTLQVVPPRTADAIEDNPLGLRITSIAWTRVASRAFPVASDTLGAARNFAAPSDRGGTP